MHLFTCQYFGRFSSAQGKPNEVASYNNFLLSASLCPLEKMGKMRILLSKNILIAFILLCSGHPPMYLYLGSSFMFSVWDAWEQGKHFST